MTIEELATRKWKHLFWKRFDDLYTDIFDNKHIVLIQACHKTVAISPVNSRTHAQRELRCERVLRMRARYAKLFGEPIQKITAFYRPPKTGRPKIRFQRRERRK